MKRPLLLLPLVLAACNLNINGPVTGVNGPINTSVGVNTSPKPGTTSTPSPLPTPTPRISLQGRLLYSLAANSDPGVPLTVHLRTRSSTQQQFALMTATASTDVHGNFTFTDLPVGEYQVEYDDDGLVATGTYNSVGLAVSDPVSVSAAGPSQQTLEIGWDLTGLQPPPGSEFIPDSTYSFSVPILPGQAEACIQFGGYSYGNSGMPFRVFPTVFNGSVANGAGSRSLTVVFVGADSLYNRMVIRYWNQSDSFGGARSYGQTRAIPVKL